MSRKPIFIMTHLCSNWEKLVTRVEMDKNIQIFNTGTSYRHPDDVNNLKSKNHKRHTSMSIWGDIIFHNHDYLMRDLCQYYNFIFWSIPFEECEQNLFEIYGNNAKRYWAYRMAGLVEYYNICPNALWNPSLEVNCSFDSIA